MYKESKILAIVTARGGSKGLPGKNIKVINGKPLLAWTIGQIKDSIYIDNVVVSTDSLEIAKMSETYGIKVPELRPNYLAADDTSSMDVLEYTINKEKELGRIYDYVMLLEPTSPLRKKGDLDKIIKLAGDNPDKDGVISVGEVHLEHPMIIKKTSNDGCLVPYNDNIVTAYQRQQYDEALFPYGVGYLIKTNVLMAKHTIYTDNVLPYHIERWQNYEIDDLYDFMSVETIMKMEAEKLWKII